MLYHEKFRTYWNEKSFFRNHMRMRKFSEVFGCLSTDTVPHKIAATQITYSQTSYIFIFFAHYWYYKTRFAYRLYGIVNNSQRVLFLDVVDFF